MPVFSTAQSRIDLTEPKHNLLLLKISRSAEEYPQNDIYNCVRSCWKLDVQKARQADYILAVKDSRIIGVYVADRWLSTDNKPEEYFSFLFQYKYSKTGRRFAFEGQEAPEHIQDMYLDKAIIALPDGKSIKAQNPVCYAFKNSETKGWQGSKVNFGLSRGTGAAFSAPDSPAPALAPLKAFLKMFMQG